MSTWRVPFKNTKTATLFAEKMSSPWKPEILEVQELLSQNLNDDNKTDTKKPGFNTSYEWQDEALFKTVGSEALTDLLYARVRHYKKPFDMRPCIRETLRPILQAEKNTYQKTGRFSKRSYTLENINLVREAIGLAPIKKVSSSDPKPALLSRIKLSLKA